MRHGLLTLILAISLITGGCAATNPARLTEIHYPESRLGHFSCQELLSQYGQVAEGIKELEDELWRRHDSDLIVTGVGFLLGAGIWGRLLFEGNDGIDVNIRKAYGIRSAIERAYNQRC